MDVWQLPGPAAFARTLADAVMDGSNVIIASPASAAQSVARMVDAQDGWGLGGIWSCEASEGLPIDDLFDALGLEERVPANRTVASLIASIGRSRRVVVSGITSGTLDAWMAFATEYESASRALTKFDRTQIVILLTAVPRHRLPRPAPALDVLVWDGWVGEADVLSYIASVWRAEGRPVNALSRLLARIVIRLALWDFDLVDRMLAWSPADILAPVAPLTEIAREDGLTPGQTWEEGGVGKFDGEDTVHALVLAAAGDTKGELMMRVWAAQAAELLPILEIRRRWLVDRMKNMPEPPARMVLDGSAVTDLDDVELGGLTHLARVHRYPAVITQEAERLRWLRNRLAHQCPVTLDEAQVLFDRRN